ncbi:MAG: relaxation protein [Xanthomonadaceae bacterium]|jgi:hypothetical protein|nr:relaxation protein [Xanthomonadaceae bacterium]
MNSEDIDRLLGKASMLMERFQRQCDHIGQQQQQLVRQLQQTTQTIPDTVQQSTRNLMLHLPETVTTQVQRGLDQPIDAFSRRLHQAGGQVGQNTQALTAQLQQLQRLYRQLSWKIIAVVFGALALLLAGGGWLMGQYRADIATHQIQADLLRAYNQADVVLCGRQLCANVDMRGTGAGDHQQYRMVLPRASAGSDAGARTPP